jgi:vacuolar-type H+-ATPase subunit E/Vma4
MAINIPIITSFSDKGVKAAAKEFANLEGTAKKAGFALNKMAVPAIAAFGAVAIGGVKAAQAASNFNETVNKSNVIFGNAAKSVQQFASTAATSLGQSKQAALDAAATFGVFGKAAGKTGEDLAGFSTQMVQLTSDLASFHNANPADVALALGAALRGESEPIRKYGVLLNDAALKAEAMAMGIYNGKGALEQSAKVLAAQSLILKQTGDAQGDFTRTSGGLANQQRILKAKIDDAVVAIGNAFIPVIEAVLPLLTNFATFVGDNAGLVSALAIGIGTLAGVIGALGIAYKGYKIIAAITTGINWALATSFTAVQIATGIGIVAVLAGLAALAAYTYQTNKARRANEQLAQSTDVSNSQAIRQADAIDDANGKIETFVPTVTGASKEVESFAAALKDKLGEAVDKAKDALKTAQDAFSEFAKTAADSIKQAFSFADARDAGAESGGGFLDGLRSQVSGIVAYTDKLQALLQTNLSRDAFQMVLDAGQEAGSAIADELIAGGQTAIDATNDLVDAANRAADKVGLNGATKWLQAGVDSAKAIVDGLQSELDKLTPKLMAKMDAIAAKMKRTVTIDVFVSNKMAEITGRLGIPAMADGGIVTGPTLALIGEQGSEAVIPLNQMGKMGGGGGAITVNVNGGLATSAEVGRAVVDAIRQFNQVSGPANIRVA